MKLIWDGFMLFLLTINIFYIPLKIAFEESTGLSKSEGLAFPPSLACHAIHTLFDFYCLCRLVDRDSAASKRRARMGVPNGYFSLLQHRVLQERCDDLRAPFDCEQLP